MYTSDIGMGGDELYAAIVPSTQALAYITSLNPSPALEMPGVVAFVGANDIPKQGRNAYQSGSGMNSVRTVSVLHCPSNMQGDCTQDQPEWYGEGITRGG